MFISDLLEIIRFNGSPLVALLDGLSGMVVMLPPMDHGEMYPPGPSAATSAVKETKHRNNKGGSIVDEN